MKQNGFTLIELLVTVVITSMLGLVIIQAFFTTITSNTKIELMKNIKQNGDFAVDVITRKVRNAKTMDCNAGSDHITVTNSDDTTSDFYSANVSGLCRILQVDNPGAVTNYVSSSDLILKGTCTGAFDVTTCAQITGQDANVSFTFTLQQKDTSAVRLYEQASQKFETTVSLRNVQY